MHHRSHHRWNWPHFNAPTGMRSGLADCEREFPRTSEYRGIGLVSTVDESMRPTGMDCQRWQRTSSTISRTSCRSHFPAGWAVVKVYRPPSGHRSVRRPGPEAGSRAETFRTRQGSVTKREHLMVTEGRSTWRLTRSSGALECWAICHGSGEARREEAPSPATRAPHCQGASIPC